MTTYRNVILIISSRFEGLGFHHIPRDNNQATNMLARMGAKRDKVPKNTFVEWIFKPSIIWEEDKQTSESTDVGQSAPPEDDTDQDIMGGLAIQETTFSHEVMVVIAPWTEPLLAYLLRKKLTEDQTDTRRILRQSKS